MRNGESGFSHIQACFTTHPTLSIPIVEGRLGLGRWQRLLLLELEGPRQRELILQVCDYIAPAGATGSTQ